MVLVLAAFREEVSLFLRRGRFEARQRHGETRAYYARQVGPTASEVAVVVSGAGVARARAAADWALREFKPKAVVSIGFGGACKDGLLAGDIVIGTEVTRLEGAPFSWDAEAIATPLKPDAALLATVRKALETAGVDFHLGRIITLPSVAKTSAMKRWLGEALVAAAVDMESYAVAQASANAGVPFIAARAVIDVAGAGLPAFVSTINSSLGVRNAGPALKSILRSPGDIALLPGLARSFMRARRSVAASLMATAFELDQSRSSQPAAAA